MAGIKIEKKPGTGAIGYLMVFMTMLLMCILTVYMLYEAKLMSGQHDIDDALADSVLASLVIDDSYYFSSQAEGEGIFRLKSTDYSWNTFKECLEKELNGNDIIDNLSISEFILYEVEGENVTVTTIASEGTAINSSIMPVAATCTPNGVQVESTSAYAKVTFILDSITGNRIENSRDIYCTVEQNEE